MLQLVKKAYLLCNVIIYVCMNVESNSFQKGAPKTQYPTDRKISRASFLYTTQVRNSFSRLILSVEIEFLNVDSSQQKIETTLTITCFFVVSL